MKVLIKRQLEIWLKECQKEYKNKKIGWYAFVNSKIDELAESLANLMKE